MKHLQLNDELSERSSLYAAGALTEEERKEYLRHLENDGCEVCRSAVREFEAAVQTLALELPLEEPSTLVKSRLMVQAALSASGTTPQKTTGRSWLAWLVPVALAAALALVIFLNIGLRNQIQTLTARIDDLEAQSSRQRIVLAALTAPKARIVTLLGQSPNVEAQGRIFWDQAEHRWWVYVRGLPPAPAGKSYQLWFVPKSGDPISAQVFDTTSGGLADLEIPLPGNAPELKIAAVTTEPAGGKPLPSGPFVLLSKAESN
jgi:anti-sigma-K factor RskA